MTTIICFFVQETAALHYEHLEKYYQPPFLISPASAPAFVFHFSNFIYFIFYEHNHRTIPYKIR